MYLLGIKPPQTFYLLQKKHNILVYLIIVAKNVFVVAERYIGLDVAE